MEIRVDVSELGDLIARLDRLPEDLSDAIEEEMDTLLLAWERDVKMTTPVDTGNLRRSYRVHPTEKGADGWAIGISNSADYAGHVEYGHRVKVHGQWTGSVVPGRYMLTRSTERASDALPKRIRRAVDKVGGKG